MKLGFTTYQLPQNLNFEESIRLAKKTGCAGIDFRTGNVYKHGVEVSLSPEERRQMRRMLEDNYLELASINSEYSFDNPDENERRKSIEGAKQCCLLASDFGSRLVRLFGNIIRTDDAHETVKYVSDAIREVCDYAATLNVTCLIEMPNAMPIIMAMRLRSSIWLTDPISAFSTTATCEICSPAAASTPSSA